MIDSKKPLYIFFHIPKTAGKTFRYHLLKNFPKDDQLEISLEDVGYSIYKLPDSNTRITPSAKLLKNKDPDSITVIHGHGVPYGIHRLFGKREARYITFMRDPANRLPSIYNHKVRLYKRCNISKNLEQDLKNTLLIRNKLPTFSKWVEEKYNTNSTNEFLTTANYLKIFGYRLDRFFFIGKTSEYNKDSLFLFDVLNINKFFIDKNISTTHYHGKIDSRLRDLINAKTIESKRLFEKAMKIRSSTIRTHQYKNAVVKKSIQKKLFLPFTQIIFAPRYTLKILLNTII